MEKLYKIEFSEKQQIFALNEKHNPTPKDWVVVTENATKNEFKIFVSFMAKDKNNLSIYQVKKEFKNLQNFIENLMQNNLEITEIN